MRMIMSNYQKPSQQFGTVVLTCGCSFQCYQVLHIIHWIKTHIILPSDEKYWTIHAWILLYLKILGELRTLIRIWKYDLFIRIRQMQTFNMFTIPTNDTGTATSWTLNHEIEIRYHRTEADPEQRCSFRL